MLLPTHLAAGIGYIEPNIPDPPFAPWLIAAGVVVAILSVLAVIFWLTFLDDGNAMSGKQHGRAAALVVAFAAAAFCLINVGLAQFGSVTDADRAGLSTWADENYDITLNREATDRLYEGWSVFTVNAGQVDLITAADGSRYLSAAGTKTLIPFADAR